MKEFVVPERVAKPVIDNTELVTRFRTEGGGVFHIRPYRKNDRGVTVAYKMKNNRIMFSTAVQHRADSFTKKIGTKTAIEHFDAGQVVIVPKTCKTASETVKLLSYALSIL